MKKLLVFGISMLVMIALAACGSDEKATEPAAPAAPTTEPTEQAEPATVKETPIVEESAEPELTMGQKNAIKKAESYLDYSSFSRSGLIEQLEFEGFDTADAEFAVDSLNVDWNEQAAKKAESYLNYSSFSRSGLIEQLEFEGFTSEQAEYGVTAVGY